MDGEEIRLARLTRIGRETIIKNGTYDMDKAREIGVNHPFYIKLDTASDYQIEFSEDLDFSDSESFEEAPVADVAENPEQLAAQILSSNFRTGMSQEEVDAFMRSMA